MIFTLSSHSVNQMNQILLRRHMESDMGWSVDAGERVRAYLEREVRNQPRGVIGIDLDGIRLMDVSFSREAVVETVRRFRPDYQFVVLNVLNEVVVENLEAALDRRGDALLLKEKDGETRIIGRQLNASLRSIFEMVKKLRSATSRDIVQQSDGLSIQNCSNKLKELWEAGLLQREELTAKSGGKECGYRFLI